MLNRFQGFPQYDPPSLQLWMVLEAVGDPTTIDLPIGVVYIQRISRAARCHKYKQIIAVSARERGGENDARVERGVAESWSSSLRHLHRSSAPPVRLESRSAIHCSLSTKLPPRRAGNPRDRGKLHLCIRAPRFQNATRGRLRRVTCYYPRRLESRTRHDSGRSRYTSPDFTISSDAASRKKRRAAQGFQSTIASRCVVVWCMAREAGWA